MKHYRLTERGRKHVKSLVEWATLTGVLFVLGCLSTWIEFYV